MSGVRLVINLHTRPGAAADYVAAWAPHGEEVRAEPGCLQYELFTSSQHPDNIALLEWWESREAFDAHWELERRRTPVGVEFLGRFKDRVEGQDTMELYWEQASYRYDEGSGTWVQR